jgi:superfamily II DNA or RNA helicase
MSSSVCDQYNQFYSEIVDPDDISKIVPSKCFNGKQIYSTRHNVNSYKNYKGKDYYKWVDSNFKDYTFDNDDFDDPGYNAEAAFNNLCRSKDYGLKKQQKFAGRIMNTHTEPNSMLIYHGLGSGKTQTSIIVGEAFKFRKTPGNVIIPDRAQARVLIVVPAALQRQYYSEIVGKLEDNTIKSAPGEVWISGNRQYYTTKPLRGSIAQNETEISELKLELYRLRSVRDPDYALIEQRANLLESLKTKNKQSVDRESVKVNTVYEIISHEKFLNTIFKLENNHYLPQESLESSFLKTPNGLLIIDEIQNLISEAGTNYRRLLYALRYTANPGFRSIFLTGTPIYDKPYEFGLLMNLLRPRVIFPDTRDEFDKLFIHDSKFINQEFFKKMCSGYISYFKGGNPLAYPRKKTIIMKHRMEDYQYEQYKLALRKEIEKDKMIGGTKKVDIYSNKLKENIATGIFNKSNQVCNIAFPQATLTALEAQQTNAQLKKNVENFKVVLKTEADQHPEPIVKIKKVLDKVREHSAKFSKVAELILNCPGTVFVYSNYVYYGVDSMAVIMEALGYSVFGSNNTKPKFFVWKGETNKGDIVDRARAAFNSPQNIDGSLLKVIFGTQTVMEGVDFKNVNQVHVLDPWWNDSRMQQVIARGIRLCSHRDLPPEYRSVNVFIHLSTLGSYETVYSLQIREPQGIRKIISKLQIQNPGSPPLEWAFNASYAHLDNDFEVQINDSKRVFIGINIVPGSIKRAPDQSLQIGGWKGLDTRSVQEYMYSRALQKLSLNRQFELAIKETAIDCSLNRNGNLIRLNEMYTPHDFLENTWNLVYENYSTGQIYKRIGAFSTTPNLPENVMTLSDILDSTTSQISTFDFETDGKRVKLNDLLIIPENINCYSGEYTFGFPKEIVELTINKEMIPMLLKLGKPGIVKLLKSIETMPNFRSSLNLEDNRLPQKITRLFSNQAQEKERAEIIAELEEYGFEEVEQQVWEEYTISELKGLLGKFKK